MRKPLLTLHSPSNNPSQVRCVRKKLLAFSENRRPPYYGSWSMPRWGCELAGPLGGPPGSVLQLHNSAACRPRHSRDLQCPPRLNTQCACSRSAAVRGRRPLGRDPGRDYEVDSDEEWEEEPEGEDLSVSGLLCTHGLRPTSPYPSPHTLRTNHPTPRTDHPTLASHPYPGRRARAATMTRRTQPATRRRARRTLWWATATSATTRACAWTRVGGRVRCLLTLLATTVLGCGWS